MSNGNGYGFSLTTFPETPPTSNNHVLILPSKLFVLYQKIFDIDKKHPLPLIQTSHHSLSLRIFCSFS